MKNQGLYALFILLKTEIVDEKTEVFAGTWGQRCLSPTLFLAVQLVGNIGWFQPIYCVISW